MKHFLKRLVLFIFALLLPFAAAVAFVQAKPAMFTGSMMGASRQKLSLLQHTDAPRILVAGGSSVPYGIVSAQVQEATGMPCLNLGATAYLGMEFYLAQMRGNLRAGDVVILAPEYTMYNNEISHSVCWMAVENDSAMLAKLPLSYWPGMLKSFFTYAAQKLDVLRLEGAPTGTPSEKYRAAGFGPWGDMVTPRSPILEHKYNTEDTRSVSEELLSDSFIRSVNRFSAYAQRQGASVYLTYAPFNRLALAGGLEGVLALETAIKAQCDVPFLGNLADGVMHEDLFFDTNNHLNSEGAQIRTEALIADLHAAGALVA